MYDMIIKGGKIIDPYGKIKEDATIYIKDGVFVEPKAGEPEEATHVIDASGLYVAPGFIDAHVHVYKGGGSFDLNTSADLYCIPNCVTTCIDGGSTGPLDFEGLYRSDIVYSTTTVKALLHMAYHGVYPLGFDEDEDPDAFDLVKAKRLVKIYGGDSIVGLKIRMHQKSAGKYGLRPLQETIRFAERMEDELGKPLSVAVHVTDLAPDVEIKDICGLLRKGDVYTHTYMGIGEKIILDKEGKLVEPVLAARERGVLFDSGGGSRNFNMNVVKNAFEQGFFPDFISTDGVGTTAYRNNFSILHHASLYLNLGMSLEDIVKAMTVTPAACYDFLDEAGTLNIGAKADVAIFDVQTKQKTFSDLWGNSIECDRLIVPMAAVKGGRIAFKQIFM